MNPATYGGFGIVGLGVAGDPSRTRKAPELCADYDHPGVTFHPQMNKTWCLCGSVVRGGDHFTHAACCGGPLEVPSDSPGTSCALPPTGVEADGGPTSPRLPVTATN